MIRIKNTDGFNTMKNSRVGVLTTYPFSTRRISIIVFAAADNLVWNKSDRFLIANHSRSSIMR